MSKQRGKTLAGTESIRLAQPDRSVLDPNHETLLDIASKRGLLQPDSAQTDALSKQITQDDDPPVGRPGESLLWSTSLAMLHFTFDVLIQHQYAVDIKWPKTVSRTLQALFAFFLMFYTLHLHNGHSMLLPRVSPAIQRNLHQGIFFVGSVVTGCYLIYVTNERGYYAVMKQAPALGCVWIWSVIELELVGAVSSLVICISYLYIGGYSFS